MRIANSPSYRTSQLATLKFFFKCTLEVIVFTGISNQNDSFVVFIFISTWQPLCAPPSFQRHKKKLKEITLHPHSSLLLSPCTEMQIKQEDKKCKT